MTASNTRARAVAFVLAATLVAASTPQAFAQEVGAAAAVRPTSQGTPPGGSIRKLDIGTKIVSRERIQTNDGGSLQVMFLDKSTLTVGPNSDMVIDEFVYNPAQGTGQFGLQLANGALRFVGGQISHNSGATVTTPVATIGIRGGAALITHSGFCQAIAEKTGQSAAECTRVVCMGGVCDVRSLIDSRRVQLRLSEAVEIGAVASAQFDVSSVSLNDIVAGGDGNIQQQATNGGANNVASTGTADQTVREQDPEPVAPPAPIPVIP